ncbi:MAG: T9SS type A sorting domain-containing protein [Bacteroidia bacterium]
MEQIPANAQNHKIDSLYAVLKTEKEDTNKVNTLNVLSEKLWRAGVVQKSDSLANNALALSEKLNFQKGRAKAFDYISNIYPVPNNGHFAITFTGLGYQSITIYDETGKKISTQLLDEKNVNISLNINLSMYPSGIYFAQILTSHGIENKKILIQK